MVAGGSSAAATEWYRDPASLLVELRQSGVSGGRPANLPGYEHLYKIGQGGQGIVYSAYQCSTRRQVAIKFLRDQPWTGAGTRMRFEREIELAARLRHPHVVSVFDSGVTTDGSLFCVMEYIDGVPLNQYVGSPTPADDRGRREASGGSPSLKERLRLFSKICEAVSYAHQRGIIHRDLKPKNILIDPAGRPHVVDFGLAKLTNEWAAGSFTLTGAFVGTLAYAAPEQLTSGGATVDVRTDVYALGVILYEMLTGRPPYATTGSMAEIVRAIQEREPAPPNRSMRIKEDLNAIMLAALAKEPDRRYQSVDALHRDIERYLAGQAVEAKRDSRWYVIKKLAAANKATVFVCLTFVFLIIAFAGGMTILYQQASTAREGETAARSRAELETRKARQSLHFMEQVLASVSPSDAGREVTVRQALDAAAARIASIPPIEAELRVAASFTVGNTYSSLGLYADAAKHLEIALLTLRALRGPDHPDVAAAQSNLAAVFSSLGRYTEAESLYQQALNSYRKKPEEHADLAALTLNNLSGVLIQKGDVAAAEPVCREALAIHRHRFGEQAHPDVALSLSNLAGLCYAKGDYSEAQSFFRQALEMYQKVGGDNRSVIAYCMNNLALAMAGEKNYRQAEQWHRRALELRRRLLGDEHPDVGNSLYNLADLLQVLDRQQEAERLCRQALALQTKALPPGHGDTARTKVLLGLLCLKRGTAIEAEPLFASAFSAITDRFGTDSQRTRDVVGRIVRGYETAGRTVEASQWRAKIVPVQASK